MVPGIESGHRYARHALEILGENFSGIAVQSVSLLSARITVRSPTECYVLFDGGC